MKRLAFIISLLTPLLGANVHAEETGPDGLTGQALVSFVQSLQLAVKSDSPKQVAALVSFPLRVNGEAGKHRKLSAAQFEKEYAQVFTPAVKAAVLKQDPKTLFRNSSGAMIGDGQVWLAGICADAKCAKSEVKLITVNTAGL